MSDFLKPVPEPKTPLGRHRILSSTSGIRVSPLCLGTMSLGESWSSFMGLINKEQAFNLLDAFHDAGGNFIDTANCYHNGETESWIGEWMTARGNREHMVIATKYAFQYKTASRDERGPGVNNSWGNHKRSMQISLRDSLQKLQTEWVDVFYVHWWDYTTSIEEVMDSLHMLVQQGKVMYLGISDTPAWVVSAANYYAKAHGKTPFSVYQGPWNIMARDFEREILPMTVHFGMALAPWDVLCSGRLQSEKQIAQRKRAGESLRGGDTEQTAEERNCSRMLLEVAKAHGSESVTAVALAYVRAKAPNVIPIVGGRKVEHLRDNIDGVDICLTEKEVDYLESAKEFDIGFPGNFIGQDWRLTGKPSVMMAAQGLVTISS